MGAHIKMALSVFALLAAATQAGAHTTYTGYSGAPGTTGRCAASCHGASGGTIQVTGFPTEYQADQVYTVTVSHSGGALIKQFNGSCRVGTGSQNAGVIASGTSTLTYTTATETNGVHLSAADLDSGSFLWTAPTAGTGEVRLYVAGHQGSSSGANTSLILTATEQTTGAPSIPAGSSGPLYLLQNNFPNPFSAETKIGFILSQPGLVRFEVVNANGELIESSISEQGAGSHTFTWNASLYPAGMYFYRIQVGSFSAARKMLVTK